MINNEDREMRHLHKIWTTILSEVFELQTTSNEEARQDEVCAV